MMKRACRITSCRLCYNWRMAARCAMLPCGRRNGARSCSRSSRSRSTARRPCRLCRCTSRRSNGRCCPGGAERRQLRILIGDGAHALNLLLWLPRERPAPTFLGLNFNGNHSTHADPAILQPAGADAARGANASRWSVTRILERGYALATLWSGELFPDRIDGRADSVQGLFAAPEAGDGAAGRGGDLGLGT